MYLSTSKEISTSAAQLCTAYTAPLPRGTKAVAVTLTGEEKEGERAGFNGTAFVIFPYVWFIL